MDTNNLATASDTAKDAVDSTASNAKTSSTQHGHLAPKKEDYFVRKILRQSAYATILLATDTTVNRPVIIKVSNIREMQQQAVILENPILEASLLRRLPRHRNLLELCAEYFTSNHHWMVLEYAESGDLFDFADRYAPFPEQFVQRVASEIGQALAHLHRYGICHLDVSMENVLLDSKLTAKLCDLGVARFMPKGHSLFPGFPNLKPGKLRYMAPELLQGLPFDGRLVDSFALGVIIFNLVTGSAPFNECSAADKRWSLILSGGVRALLIASDPDMNNMVSDAAVDLMNHLLVPATSRWTVDQALSHAWLRIEDPHA